MRVFQSLIIAIAVAAPSLAWGNVFEGCLVVDRQPSITHAVEMERGDGQSFDTERFHLQTVWHELSWENIDSLVAVKAEHRKRVTGSFLIPGSEVRFEDILHVSTVADFTRVVHSSSPDEVDMVSYLWGELFAGVDIVGELRGFALRMRGRDAKRTLPTTVRDSRSVWKLKLTYRTADAVELTARVNGRGQLMRGGKLGWELNAADLILDDVGVSATYRNGELDIDLDRVKLNHTMAARLEMRF